MITSDIVNDLKEELNTHPVYAAVQNVDDLRLFMQHHVFSVWDFMSLVKYLQSAIAPSSYPWVPPHDAQMSRFINDIVVEEESDEMPDGESFLSHYEMYLAAMEEVGADTTVIRNFVQTVREKGIEEALSLPEVPEASRTFTGTTFDFIKEGKPYNIAAAFSLGREDIIPVMFKALLKKIGISKKDSPMFHYYLERHIHLDEGFHGPMAMKLLNQLCEDKEEKIQEAEEAAKRAVKARIDFWDGVLATMNR
jgi:hypothetical protein